MLQREKSNKLAKFRDSSKKVTIFTRQGDIKQVWLRKEIGLDRGNGRLDFENLTTRSRHKELLGRLKNSTPLIHQGDMKQDRQAER